jgi:hypothetical protein
MSTCHAVYSQLAHLASKLKDPEKVPSELMIEMINYSRFRELRRRYDWELKRKMGVSFKNWAAGKLPGIKFHRLFLEYGLQLLKQTPFRIEMIIGGYSGDHGMFFRAVGKEHLEEETSPGVYAIGSGQVKAMEHLNKRGQNIHMSLARTLLHVYEAMLAAQSTNVGPPPEYVGVIKKREPKPLVYPLRSLETWRTAYASRPNTASLDDSSGAGTEVLSRLAYLKDEDIDSEW